jgi:predicted O-linked N-acetylglucosamine transferase (SPINDLY family)
VFKGHTSAVDALWSGVPLITVPGELLIGRVSASLLTAAKVPELIASDLEEYEETAVKLAKDSKFYNQIRQKVKKPPSPPLPSTPLLSSPLFSSTHCHRCYNTLVVLLLFLSFSF